MLVLPEFVIPINSTFLVDFGLLLIKNKITKKNTIFELNQSKFFLKVKQTRLTSCNGYYGDGKY